MFIICKKNFINELKKDNVIYVSVKWLWLYYVGFVDGIEIVYI